ncbi:1-(5-phosphoribosyl)-5-[(5-phosphoribosylamino)methylideneamino]imidazole-4-carboxamide isomerase [Loigolactobacillus backii]|uniref:1-(5-phosphoribosyl)-5-[(5- phosphoribosylamino)methylideneamino]imidazole-4- carboxamide isomerase n=1 Tax=Loigolactobacillus backii TaxID=375175 RepID=UPI000C1CA5EF|nr:1-(5-phosphoribosyl)-5-[(5-phosphoribosylamino)methylideneamino]imidazole-4-carboxamide isomerase [Loigolactobacillus backii]PIO82175.1 1-(5-phosphoribosyl)-5-[(5-phosphoribosylamino)methylideneamino]imidazole-4-carboxamide isomerase [Loigolactobacillus backii]
MNVFPAIDLQAGHSVRLYQGQFDQQTLINADPVAQAKQIEAANLTNLHLVDLDGAKDGLPVNQAVIQKIRKQTRLFIEVGGGIRNLQQIERYLNLGIDRVIIGSAALNNPELVAQAVRKFGATKIVVGLDGKNGQVATDGWLKQSKTSISAALAAMLAVGVQTFIVTDIQRDGTMSGPNVNLLAQLQQQYPAAVIVASGGIRNLADLKQLAKNKVQSSIIGKALYEGTVTLAELAEVE